MHKTQSNEIQEQCIGEGDLLSPIPEVDDSDLLSLRPDEDLASIADSQDHVLKKGALICKTDYRPPKRSRTRIVVDATDGFIPLWEENMVLRWRFNAASLSVFQHPEAIESRLRSLLNQAIVKWGDAVPIRFDENSDNSDFEIVMERFRDCNAQGACVLAEAFFPDAGRHRLRIFPSMFDQNQEEQVDTLAHEIGHIFGLRHFFAQAEETDWPSEIFGEHNPFSIMNYGVLSTITDADKRDLKLLYEGAWSRQLRKINGTPIKLLRPFHYFLA